ncbi:hypothetical protein DYB31_012435 [Aphanomyces astaci]|uniref:ABC transmembrane type-1 domain-containing protein n=1 Tax=Aphanomyces astaci TaxID=112090 RepID=A0A397EKQ5_APHAT|nr:hypothetical protein DYB31_012435 [Aphanomyces astaci]
MVAQSKLAGGVALSVIALALAIREKGQKDAESACSLNSQYTPEKKKGQDKKVAINNDFLERFMRLFRIIVPGLWTPEVAYALLVAGLLTARTTFDITILHMMTSIERAIGSRKDFVHHLSRFLLVMLPVSVVNCLLKYGQTELSLRFRTRLSTYLYTKYLHEYTYYKVSNLDTRITNPDQLLTVDVERFATSVADLYSNVTKPLLDISIYAYKLAGTIGLSGPTTMLSYLVGSGVFLTWLRQPTGRFTIAEQRLEGNYRFVNARLITHSEEIAFYHGNKREHAILQSSYDALVHLIRQAQQFRFSISVVDNIIAKVYHNVPVMTPNGDVLVPSLSFKVESGMNVVVCGPNGCGKSSLFRLLGELWPLFGGKVTQKSIYLPT